MNDIRYLCDSNNGMELIFCDNSTISYPLHNHVSIFTIGMVLKGEVILHTNHDSRVYGKEQSFTIFPYVPHSIQASGSYTLICVCIPKSFLNCPNDITYKIKVDIANLLVGALGLEKINHRQICQLLSCLDDIKEVKSSFITNANTGFIDDLKRQLEMFPENKLSLEEMAQATFISKYHFIRSFKEVVGLTPHQFQLQNRIRKAQRLINNVVTIAELASSTGFCDQSHFIKQFEKRVGLTPRIYKMSCQVINSVLS